MSELGELAFAPEESAAIMRHMNNDHPEDSVLMCKALAGLPGTVSAEVSAVDKAGITFIALVSGKPVETTIAWSHQLKERAEVRGEVVRLYQEACAALGIEPRQAEQGRH